MSRWLAFLCELCSLFVVAVACHRQSPPPPLVAQVSGAIEVSGLSAPVRIVRDRSGVPHVYAQNQDDLFLAQGFVQAQDRLFQMDLWRRSAQGRLSQVLGPNFIERDAMTRRIQYRGDVGVEWASYGPDARAIAAAFVRGINTWVSLARERPPEEFVLAGWKPEFWSPVDLLNRTDAFLSSGDAMAEVRRAKLSDVIGDAIGRVGTAPFFAGPSANTGRDRTQARSISRAAVTRNGDVSISETNRAFTNPSSRYFVHLKAPGWNVIGATAPWLPGVALGHNERVAWGMTPIDVDTQDVYVESGMGGARIGTDAIAVKGRRTPFAFETEITPHGIVVAVDREHDRRFTLRWSGTEAGAAAELGALALDRAQSWSDFRAALARWKMPARRVLYADVSGNIGFQDAAFVPIRARSGHAGQAEWAGWLPLDALPHAFNPAGGMSPPPAPDAPSSDTPAVFAHVLAITDIARARFNVGPLPRPHGDDSPLQLSFDPRNWDRARAIVAPGQSESPASPHFADLARQWTAGERFPLVYNDEAVAANAEATLRLVPQSASVPRP